MNKKEMVLNAAIFAVAKLQDKGSTAYCVKDRSGEWHQMDWSVVIRLLYDMLKEIDDGNS